MQGLTLVHFSAQFKPFLRQNTLDTPSYPPHTLKTPPKQSLNAPPIAQKTLKLSRKVDECKPLPRCLRNHPRHLGFPKDVKQLHHALHVGRNHSAHHLDVAAKLKLKPKIVAIHHFLVSSTDSPYRHVHRTFGGGTLRGVKNPPIKIDFQPKTLSPSNYQIFPIKIIASKSSLSM